MELPKVPIVSQRQHNFERGKGQYLHHVSEGEKERRLLKSWKLLINSETLAETISESQTGVCESLWKKMIGKPCAGKPHARFEVAGDGKVLWRI